MFKEFRTFVMRGNVVDLAVGIIIGGAFGVIVKSLVDDIIMPPIGLLLGDVNFTNLFLLLKAGSKAPPPYATLADAQGAGAVTMNYGVFLTNVVTFLIVAFAVYLLVRTINQLRGPEEVPVTTRECPYCHMSIPLAAVRCPHCTSEIR